MNQRFPDSPCLIGAQTCPWRQPPLTVARSPSERDDTGGRNALTQGERIMWRRGGSKRAARLCIVIAGFAVAASACSVPTASTAPPADTASADSANCHRAWRCDTPTTTGPGDAPTTAPTVSAPPRRGGDHDPGADHDDDDDPGADHDDHDAGADHDARRRCPRLTRRPHVAIRVELDLEHAAR